MSKERLENMKSTIKLIKDYVEAETHHFETLALATELILNHGEWLIEQAELGISQQEQFHDYQTQNLRLQKQVQELKEWKEKAQQLHESLKRQDEVLDRLRQQNKRYRDLLEKVDYLLEKAGESNENVYDLISYVRTLIGLEGEE